jgi:hypothetical protein
MSNDDVDPSGNTGQFKAFAQAPPEIARSRMRLVIGGVVALVFVVLVAYLAFS